MASYSKEDWIYIDQHNEAIEYLEGKIRTLEELVENAEDDEVFILSKIIDMRELAVKKECWSIVGACDYIIGLHTATVYIKAKGKARENGSVVNSSDGGSVRRS